MLCNLRVGPAPLRAVNAGVEGHVLRLQVGGLFAELPHHGVLLETGSLLIREWRRSSCTDINCIGVSLWPLLTLASFDVNEAQAGPYTGLSKHLSFTCSSVTLPNSPECLVLEDIFMVMSALTSGWLAILNYLFCYLAPVVFIQNSYLMFCTCSPHFSTQPVFCVESINSFCAGFYQRSESRTGSVLKGLEPFLSI